MIRDIGNRPTETPVPAAYLPATVGLAPSQLLVARTAGYPALLLETIKREIRSIDRSAAVGTFTLQEIIQNTYAQPRFTTIILAAFAGTGLLLVLVGVYGVMAYAVARRRHEIAIRMALGADRRHVLRGVLRTAALLLVSGISAGLVASIATNRLLAAQLPVAADMDPLTMVVAAGLIVCTGLMASYVPARRAARVDPMEALRHE